MQGKKIAVIGGGHGTSVVMRSLSGSGVELSAILSMADDGGSTGRLRVELGSSAVGDIRQCLAALSTKPDIAELFSYRFESGSLKGHSLGNLFLAAGEKRTGSLEKSIEIARKTLGVVDSVIPSTNDDCHLVLKMPDKEARGVYEIANVDFAGEKPDLSLVPEAKISAQAKSAIEKADFIVLAPGNFYCSIIPALLVDGMADFINNSLGKVIFVANLVNRNTHTNGFKVDDYLAETKRLAGITPDGVVYNTAPIPVDYLREGEETLSPDPPSYKNSLGRHIADEQRIKADPTDKIAAIRSLVRHDPAKLRSALNEIIRTF